ncbi:hypothetical protein BDR05DRAFT_960478, partial [Suillus weaverae]
MNLAESPEDTAGSAVASKIPSKNFKLRKDLAQPRRDARFYTSNFNLQGTLCGRNHEWAAAPESRSKRVGVTNGPSINNFKSKTFDYHMVRFPDTRQPKCPDTRRHDTIRTMVRKTSEHHAMNQQLSTDHERAPSTPRFLDAPRHISFPKARFGPVQKRQHRFMVLLTDQVRLVTSL